jgi:hypothetical protein
MPPNGPAIEVVFVAEGPEAVGSIYRIDSKFSKAVGERSMARFLPSWYKFSDVQAVR